MILMGCKISEKNLKIPKKNLDKPNQLWIMVAETNEEGGKMRCLMLKMIDAMDARMLAAQKVLDMVSWIGIVAGAILIGCLI